VAQEQRQWAQAERYYQQALEIYIEFNDRYSQASTYHQLGRVAQEQRQWAQAREYLLKDLEISAELGDEHDIGITFRSLARLWQASGDKGLPEAMASILQTSPAEVQALLRQILAGGEGGDTTEDA
jgi:tetratricopeptide (TPR) repeat protein